MHMRIKAAATLLLQNQRESRARAIETCLTTAAQDTTAQDTDIMAQDLIMAPQDPITMGQDITTQDRIIMAQGLTVGLDITAQGPIMAQDLTVGQDIMAQDIMAQDMDIIDILPICDYN